ncbi:MAG: TRAP-type C4-dicarboxylate transport system substrate-binding protein [Myxococcota bacterium]|jgi:TRAP-type C4-dicarboxylate transport system substrate-binding protein
MKRFIAAGAALSAAAFALFATPSQADGTTELSIGSLAPTNSVWWEMLKSMERQIESQSNGQIDFVIRPPGQMGEVEMVRETRRGERLQGCAVTTAALAEGGNVAALQVVELPYLFNDFAEADHILDNVLWTPVNELLGRRGFVLGAWSENGFRSFATKGKPIRTPEDLRGFKMRSQESAVHMAMYSAYGAQAVQKSMTETLTALQSGVVDGLDNPPLFLNLGGLSGPLEYYTVSEHIYQPAAIVWSKRFYDGLTPELRAILDAQKALATSARVDIRSENDAFQELLSEELEVIVLTEAEKAEFRRVGRGMHSGFAASVDGGTELLSTIQTELDRRRSQ